MGDQSGGPRQGGQRFFPGPAGDDRPERRVYIIERDDLMAEVRWEALNRLAGLFTSSAPQMGTRIHELMGEFRRAEFEENQELPSVADLARALHEQVASGNFQRDIQDHWTRTEDLLVSAGNGPRNVVVVASLTKGTTVVATPEKGLNPGAARWLGNRLIEVAALIEIEQLRATEAAMQASFPAPALPDPGDLPF